MTWTLVGPREALGKTPFSSTYSNIFIYALKGSAPQRYTLEANRFKSLQDEPWTKVALARVSSPHSRAAHSPSQKTTFQLTCCSSQTMRQCPLRREGVSHIDKLFPDRWAWSKINWSTWRVFPLIPKRFELGPNVKANTINSAWEPIRSQVPIPQHRCHVLTARYPAYSAGCLPSAPAPHFPGDLAPFTALQFSSLQVIKTCITAPRSTATRKGHSTRRQAEVRGERTKINKLPVHKERGLPALGQLC